MGGRYVQWLIHRFFTDIPQDHSETRDIQCLIALRLQAGKELEFLGQLDKILLQIGLDFDDKTTLVSSHSQLVLVNPAVPGYFMENALEKYDNPLDITVPQTYAALRPLMDFELTRRRAADNQDHQMETLLSNNGSNGTQNVPPTGNGKVNKRKGELCRKHIKGTCPHSGAACRYLMIQWLSKLLDTNFALSLARLCSL